MTIKINIDDAFNVTFVNRPTHHNGFRILYADSKTAQFLGNGEPCDHHKHCGGAAILESNNEDLLCQDHAEEYRPCDSCDIHVRAGEQNGYGEDYLCPDCFVPATSPEDIEHAMSLDPHAVRGDTGWVDPNIVEATTSRLEHAMAADPQVREVQDDTGRVDPNIPELSEEMCVTFLEESGFKVEKVEGFDLNEMYIHDWLIFIVDFDQDNYCGEYRIAIHKDVVNPSKASHADCSSPEPEDCTQRYGPGTCATALSHIDNLYATLNDVHRLADEGYIDGQKAHLIFQEGGAS